MKVLNYEPSFQYKRNDFNNDISFLELRTEGRSRETWDIQKKNKGEPLSMSTIMYTNTYDSCLNIL